MTDPVVPLSGNTQVPSTKLPPFSAHISAGSGSDGDKVPNSPSTVLHLHPLSSQYTYSPSPHLDGSGEGPSSGTHTPYSQ